MATNTLTDLYIEKLKDLYNAEHQILKALPKMVKAATHGDLQDAFETHRRQTETHVRRLDQIFEELGRSPEGKTCHGMKGIIEEGAELMQEEPEAALLDAGLIAGAQGVEHYEMAGYGSARTWAEQLGYSEQAQLLQQTLDEERQTDKLLTELAEQMVNPDAEAGLSVPGLADRPTRQRVPKPLSERGHSRPSAEDR
jgi:ferritin-like metal-binding protein YciE